MLMDYNKHISLHLCQDEQIASLIPEGALHLARVKGSTHFDHAMGGHIACAKIALRSLIPEGALYSAHTKESTCITGVM